MSGSAKETHNSEDREEKQVHAEDDPTEEADASDCDATIRECEIKGDERDGHPQDSQFDPQDELHDAFPVEEIPVVLMPDGMPSPVDPPGGLSLAHPFTIESMVCIEDERIYEEVFVEEIVGEHGAYMHVTPYSYFKQSLLSKYEDEGKKKRPRRTFKPDEIKDWYGTKVVTDVTGRVMVRPIRERCKYYKRMVLALDGTKPEDHGHFLVFRNCMMRRSVGGAFLSLRDEAVYACDYRDPPDPKSVEKHLDAKDREKLEKRPDLTMVPMFGTGGEDVRLQEKK